MNTETREKPQGLILDHRGRAVSSELTKPAVEPRLMIPKSEVPSDTESEGMVTVPEYLEAQMRDRGRAIPVAIQLAFGRFVKSIARSFGVTVPTVEGGVWGPRIGLFSPMVLDTAWQTKAEPMLRSRWKRMDALESVTAPDGDEVKSKRGQMELELGWVNPMMDSGIERSERSLVIDQRPERSAL